MVKGLVATAAAVFLAAGAWNYLDHQAAVQKPAIAFDAETSCRSLIQALDAGDQASASAAYRFVESVMYAEDQKQTAKRRPSLFAPMSPEGSERTIISGWERCRQYPNKTVQSAAVDAYAGIRAIGAAVGQRRP